MSDHSLTHQLNQSITSLSSFRLNQSSTRAITPMRAGVTLVYQECNAITPQNTVVSGLSTQVCTYCNTPQVRYAHQRTVMLQSAVLSGCALACLLRVRPNITFRLRRVDTFNITGTEGLTLDAVPPVRCAVGVWIAYFIYSYTLTPTRT